MASRKTQTIRTELGAALAHSNMAKPTQPMRIPVVWHRILPVASGNAQIDEFVEEIARNCHRLINEKKINQRNECLVRGVCAIKKITLYSHNLTNLWMATIV
jgi:hypothetical protein